MAPSWRYGNGPPASIRATVVGGLGWQVGEGHDRQAARVVDRGQGRDRAHDADRATGRVGAGVGSPSPIPNTVMPQPASEQHRQDGGDEPRDGTRRACAAGPSRRHRRSVRFRDGPGGTRQRGRGPGAGPARDRAPPALAGTGRRASGVPAHVTVLFPFLPARDLVPAVRRDAGARSRRPHGPFEVAFADGRAVPGRRLPRARARPRRSPADHAADRGPLPGLPAVRRRVRRGHPAPDRRREPRTRRSTRSRPRRAGTLPFGCRVTALEVLVEGGDGRWRRRWRIPLGDPAALGARP